MPAPAPSLATRRNSIGMELVRIPAGEFMMGSDSDRPDEKPAHKVVISQPFYLGKYEVTQAQWQEVMGTNPSHFKGDPNRPVERVSWKMVQEFISKLNAREGIICTGYRPKRNGNTRRGPGQRPNTILGTRMRSWSSMPGITRTTRAPRIPSGNSSRTSGACTT